MSSILVELIKKNLMTAEQVFELKEKSSVMKRPVQGLMVETGFLKEEDFFNLARQVSFCPVVDLDQAQIDPEFVKMLSVEKAISHGVFPIQREGNNAVVAMSDPGDVIARDELGFLTDMNIKPVL